MIGISLGDLIKLLDQVPGWKAVAGLPKRVAELEARVAALEAKPLAKPAEACPLCDAPMRVTAVQADPIFGIAGLKQHTLQCTACPHTEKRQVDPKKR